MELITVNKQAKETRIDAEYERVLGEVKRQANLGYSSFYINVNGDYTESSDVCSKLEEHGVHSYYIRERGFAHNGDGEGGYAMVKFYI